VERYQGSEKPNETMPSANRLNFPARDDCSYKVNRVWGRTASSFLKIVEAIHIVKIGRLWLATSKFLIVETDFERKILADHIDGSIRANGLLSIS